MKPLLSCLATFLVLLAGAPALAQDADTEPKPFSDHLSGASFITHDLKSTLDFYTRFVGLVQRGKTRQLSDEASLLVWGVTDGQPLEYATLVPKGWPELYPGHPGFNFAQRVDAKRLLPQNKRRAPQSGEPVMAFSVRNIAQKVEQMAAAEVPILVPLAKSGSGQSMTITVMDPNGMRVQLYEFLQ